MAQHLGHAAATIHARDQEISQLIGKVVGLETLQARLAQENGLLVARGKSLEGELLALEQSYQAYWPNGYVVRLSSGIGAPSLRMGTGRPAKLGNAK